MKLVTLAIVLFAATASWADDEKVKAAVGGGVGGAVGAVVGEELGDREGAIIGSALGAAIGTAIATDEGDKPVTVEVEVAAEPHPKGRHCPPGQAKKGRC